MSGKYGYEDQPFMAELYDFVYDEPPRKDVEFYVDLARKAGGKTLELGCGTGRVLVPSAIAGCDITGLDLSPYMLNKCREKLAAKPAEIQKRVRLVQGNMTDFDVDEQFQLVTIPFRPFQHLITIAEQKACLKNVAKHLKPGGLLALDVFHPFIPRLIDPKYLMEISVKTDIRIPDGKTLTFTNRTVAFHREEQYNEIELVFYINHQDGSRDRLVQSFKMRYFYRYEMEHLLELCGFEIAYFFGDFDRSPFTPDSPEMIFVARKV